MTFKNYNKIPFEKSIADNTLTICDLFIELSKSFENKLTTDQLIELKNNFYKKYYNDKVELLEVLEN